MARATDKANQILVPRGKIVGGSSAIHNSHAGWDPPHDLPKTISRIRAVGLREKDGFTMSTLRPAQVLGLQGEIGTLAPGASGDVSVVRWNEEPMPLADTLDGVRSGPALEPVVTVRAGRVFEL